MVDTVEDLNEPLLRLAGHEVPSAFPLSDAHNHLGLQQRQLLCHHPPCL